MEKVMVLELKKLKTEEAYVYEKFIKLITDICQQHVEVDPPDTSECGSVTVAAPPKVLLQCICETAANIKRMGLMNQLLPTRLTHLLNILKIYILNGIEAYSPRLKEALYAPSSKAVLDAYYALLTSLYILTAKGMHKTVFLEDIIDRIILFIKSQLQSDDIDLPRKLKSNGKEKEKRIESWVNKRREAIGLLTELLYIQVLTESQLVQVSTAAIIPFGTDNFSLLQLPTLKLITVIFMKYKTSRRSLFNDFLVSFTKLSITKKNAPKYTLNCGKNIQMISALVLSLVQSVATLPEEPHHGLKYRNLNQKDVNYDELIINNYLSATTVAANLVLDLFTRCTASRIEADYRFVFEGFVQDILTTVNSAEWPAAVLLLKVLGRFLVDKFINKTVDISHRVLALDCVGVMITRLWRDAVLVQQRIDEIDQIICAYKVKQQIVENDQLKEGTNSDHERILHLQQIVLHHMALNFSDDEVTRCARHLCISQWYFEIKQNSNHQFVDESVNENSEKSSRSETGHRSKEKNIIKDKENAKSQSKDHCKTKGNSKSASRHDTKSKSPKIRDKVSHKQSEIRMNVSAQKEKELRKKEVKKLNIKKKTPMSVADVQKILLIRRIKLCNMKSTFNNEFQEVNENKDIELVLQYIIMNGELNKNLDVYLQHIFHVLSENNITIRSRAMKTLTQVLEANPLVLNRPSIQLRVKASCLDRSISVREAAVDLLGRFVLKQPQLIQQYYDLLAMRILDTGVSVRKRVVRIFHSICVEHPDCPKCHEMCLHILKRVNDDEGIRNKVLDIFKDMWFKPVSGKKDQLDKVLGQKLQFIIGVIGELDAVGQERFEQLLQQIFNPQDENSKCSKRAQIEQVKDVMTACEQIVNRIVENVLQQNLKEGSTDHTIMCLKALFLFAKSKPQLLVPHIVLLLPYLSLRGQAHESLVYIIGLLEFTVPLVDYPGELLLSQLEEDLVRLSLMDPNQNVVVSCISCLGAVVNNVTHNYQLIRDLFLRFYGHINDIKTFYERNATLKDPALIKFHVYVKRAIFIVGLLIKHFDFTNKEVTDGLEENINDQVFALLLYLSKHQDSDIQLYAVIAIGSVCSKHHECMLLPELQESYQHILTSKDISLEMKLKVLSNVENYLQGEEQHMVKLEKNWNTVSSKEKLSEVDGASSGTAGQVIPLHLSHILGCCLHSNSHIRHSVIRVIRLIWHQGLVPPIQLVPHLICLSTDVKDVIRESALKFLEEAESAYPGTLYLVVQAGLELAFKLQVLLQHDGQVLRGFEGEPPRALLGHAYRLLRKNKSHRRGFAHYIIKQFENEECRLSQLLFLSDNLAHFPFEILDEPLFIIHHIDIVISTKGFTLLQKFQKALLGNPEHNQNQACDSETEDEEVGEEIKARLLVQVPDDVAMLNKCSAGFHKYQLLLLLRNHLKAMYNITDTKIVKYFGSPSKDFDKAIIRSKKTNFNPTVTLQKLQKIPKASVVEDEKVAIVEQYLKFKQLVHKCEVDDDTKYGHSGPTNIQPKDTQASANVDNVCKVASKRKGLKDVRHQRSKSSPLKRQKRNRSKNKIKRSDDDNDDDDDDDPDFLI